MQPCCCSDDSTSVLELKSQQSLVVCPLLSVVRSCLSKAEEWNDRALMIWFLTLRNRPLKNSEYSSNTFSDFLFHFAREDVFHPGEEPEIVFWNSIVGTLIHELIYPCDSGIVGGHN